jgi:hypothetical protein
LVAKLAFALGMLAEERDEVAHVVGDRGVHRAVAVLADVVHPAPGVHLVGRGLGALLGGVLAHGVEDALDVDEGGRRGACRMRRADNGGRDTAGE